MTAAEEDRRSTPAPRLASRRPVLSVRDVRTRFRTPGGGMVHAVNGIGFDLHEGELLGVVGESGSGKSVTMLSLLGLLPTPPAEIASGRALLDGEDLLALAPGRLRHVRGAKVGWQAVSTVNPYLSGGTKDIEAASLVLEPLARYDDTGTMVSALAADIPTVENGGVSADLMSIAWPLRQDVA